MKPKDKQLITSLTQPQLIRQLSDLKQKMAKAKLDLKAGKLKNTRQMGLMRYQIALVKTLIK